MTEWISKRTAYKVLSGFLQEFMLRGDDKIITAKNSCNPAEYTRGYKDAATECYKLIGQIPAADVAPVRHGRWMFEAHKEKTNCRWNVTAECSECCDQKNEVWAGFFTGVPDWLAGDTALLYAKEVKLDNYCANCGAKMDGESDNA